MSESDTGGFAPLDSPETQTATESAGSTGPFDVLLETEPDLQPEREADNLGVSPAAGHAYVGLRKVLHAVTGVHGGSHGTPAIVNFGMAGFMTVSGMQDAPDELHRERDSEGAGDGDGEPVEWDTELE